MLANRFSMGVHLLLLFLLLGCGPEERALTPDPMAAAISIPATNTRPAPTNPAISNTRPPTITSSPTTTPTATNPPTQTPPPSATPTNTPSPTPIGPCSERIPQDDLLTLVTRHYPISRYYAPTDLVPLSDYFSVEVTLGYPSEVRDIIVIPLQNLIQDMQAAGLQPFIISGYRSYAAQVIARQKWANQYPDWVDNISAVPGTSEHQLGTTVDFGSPELPEIVGQADIEFHTYFYMTSEGQWLLEHAHEYGFTLSYPREAFELTGFYYEPWHFRYVGEELATQLKNQGTTLTAYLLETQPVPCIPASE